MAPGKRKGPPAGSPAQHHTAGGRTDRPQGTPDRDTTAGTFQSVYAWAVAARRHGLQRELAGAWLQMTTGRAT